MQTEIFAIVRNIETVMDGEPWYGRAIYKLLGEVDPATASIKPDKESHSCLELLYHMITWADFTLKRILKAKEDKSDELDWRTIIPGKHNWEDGLSEYIAIHQEIIARLRTLDDDFLKEKVDFRPYNFRFLLNGLIQHNISHAGQIAYLNKMKLGGS